MTTVPASLDTLAALFADLTPPDGYEPADDGAWVDWEQLTTLSATQRATLEVARGLATAERAGVDWPPPVAASVHRAVGAIYGDPRDLRAVRSGR